MSAIDTRVSVADGKYTVVLHPDGTGTALRYGTPWPAMNPLDNMTVVFAQELADARDALAARKAAAADHADPNLPPGEYVVTVDTVGGAATVNAGPSDTATIATLQALLTAAEKARDAAHAALALIPAVADEIFEKWDKDMRPAKLLTAMAGRLKGYRPDVTEIVAAVLASPAAAKAKAIEAERDAMVGPLVYRSYACTREHAVACAYLLSLAEADYARDPSSRAAEVLELYASGDVSIEEAMDALAAPDQPEGFAHD